MQLEEILTALIQSLAATGLIDVKRLREKLEMIDEFVFYCTDKRLDYDKMAREIQKHPIVLECTRQRAYNATIILSERIGRPVYRILIGRRFNNVYLLYTDAQKTQVHRIYLGGGRQNEHG